MLKLPIFLLLMTTIIWPNASKASDGSKRSTENWEVLNGAIEEIERLESLLDKGIRLRKRLEDIKESSECILKFAEVVSEVRSEYNLSIGSDKIQKLFTGSTELINNYEEGLNDFNDLKEMCNKFNKSVEKTEELAKLELEKIRDNDSLSSLEEFNKQKEKILKFLGRKSKCAKKED